MIDDRAVEAASRAIRDLHEELADADMGQDHAEAFARAALAAAAPHLAEGWQPPEGYVLVKKEVLDETQAVIREVHTWDAEDDVGLPSWLYEEVRAVWLTLPLSEQPLPRSTP